MYSEPFRGFKGSTLVVSAPGLVGSPALVSGRGVAGWSHSWGVPVSRVSEGAPVGLRPPATPRVQQLMLPLPAWLLLPLRVRSGPGLVVPLYRQLGTQRLQLRWSSFLYSPAF